MSRTCTSSGTQILHTAVTTELTPIRTQTHNQCTQLKHTASYGRPLSVSLCFSSLSISRALLQPPTDYTLGCSTHTHLSWVVWEDTVLAACAKTNGSLHGHRPIAARLVLQLRYGRAAKTCLARQLFCFCDATLGFLAIFLHLLELTLGPRGRTHRKTTSSGFQ